MCGRNVLWGASHDVLLAPLFRYVVSTAIALEMGPNEIQKMLLFNKKFPTYIIDFLLNLLFADFSAVTISGN